MKGTKTFGLRNKHFLRDSHLALLAGKILEGRERRKGQVTDQHQIRVLTSKGKPYDLIILFWIL